MAIQNYTTKIAPEKTIGEISKLLSSRKATKIVIDYEDGQPIGLSFLLEFRGRLVAYSLPCNWSGVLSSFKKSKVPRSSITKEQALRTGWRILKDWIAAQMAIIDAELAEMAEVFLPYAVTAGGQKLFEYMKEATDEGWILLNQPNGK